MPYTASWLTTYVYCRACVAGGLQFLAVAISHKHFSWLTVKGNCTMQRCLSYVLELDATRSCMLGRTPAPLCQQFIMAAGAGRARGSCGTGRRWRARLWSAAGACTGRWPPAGSRCACLSCYCSSVWVCQLAPSLLGRGPSTIGMYHLKTRHALIGLRVMVKCAILRLPSRLRKVTPEGLAVLRQPVCRKQHCCLRNIAEFPGLK